MILPILATRNLADIGLLPSGVSPPTIEYRNNNLVMNSSSSFTLNIPLTFGGLTYRADLSALPSSGTNNLDISFSNLEILNGNNFILYFGFSNPPGGGTLNISISYPTNGTTISFNQTTGIGCNGVLCVICTPELPQFISPSTMDNGPLFSLG